MNRNEPLRSQTDRPTTIKSADGNSNQFTVGTVIQSRYELSDRIQVGGMGEVWKAKDLSMPRNVAIKFIRPELLKDGQLQHRFRTEGEIVAKLDHADIVPIYDMCIEKDVCFIVMKLMSGGTLQELIDAKAPFSVSDAAALLRPVFGALEAVHESGIVHRDIKPSNILLDSDGSIKLGDFGLAKSPDGLHSLSGQVLGTIDYMSPEQRRGLVDLDHRSDIWSLGAVLYLMITGHPPSPIDLELVEPAVRAEIRKSLSIAPQDRFDSASKFLTSLLEQNNSDTKKSDSNDQYVELALNRLHNSASRQLDKLLAAFHEQISKGLIHDSIKTAMQIEMDGRNSIAARFSRNTLKKIMSGLVHQLGLELNDEELVFVGTIMLEDLTPRVLESRVLFTRSVWWAIAISLALSAAIYTYWLNTMHLSYAEGGYEATANCWMISWFALASFQLFVWIKHHSERGVCIGNLVAFSISKIIDDPVGRWGGIQSIAFKTSELKNWGYIYLPDRTVLGTDFNFEASINRKLKTNRFLAICLSLFYPISAITIPIIIIMIAL